MVAGAMSRPARLVRALSLAVFVGGSGVASPLAAAPPSKVSAADRERAEKAYQASLDLYRKGKYRAAIERLEDARAIDPEAKELPYNLGLVHEKLGEIDDAIRYFELYLTLEADEGERERVRATIRSPHAPLPGARAATRRSASRSARRGEPTEPSSARGSSPRSISGAGRQAYASPGRGCASGTTTPSSSTPPS